MKRSEKCPVCAEPFLSHNGHGLAFCQGVAQLILIADRLGQLVEKMDAKTNTAGMGGPDCVCVYCATGGEYGTQCAFKERV